MKKLPILLCAVLFCCSKANAANIGDVIGDIYSTDIIADVSGAPIRSFSLNGKTAIILEDLRRYGFEVGYNDDLRALYACVLENTFTAQPDEVERGKCGEIIGHTYYSDITASINGVNVPCFSLNGETAAAIEDIACDITQADRSDTGMMYRWNAENRTISLLPDYDNSVQAKIVFNKYNSQPYIENGILKYTAGFTGADIPADIPDGAYKYPIRWGSEDGEIVGYAYDSKKNMPVGYEDGTREMTSKRRIITHFDIGALSRLAEAEKIGPQSFDDVLKRETDRLAESGTPPEVYSSERGTVLRSGTDITIVQKSENSDAASSVKFIGTAVRHSGFPPVQMTRERPSAADYEFAGMSRTDSFDSSSDENGVQTYSTPGCFFTYKTAGGRYYEGFAGFDGYFEDLEAVPRETDLGTMYSLVSAAPPVPGRFAHSEKLSVDGNERTVPAVSYISGMYGPWVPAKDLAELLGGTAAVSEDGFTLEITTDKKEHKISSEQIIPENPSMCGKTLFETRADQSKAPLNLKSRITLDGKEVSTEVKRSVSTAGMSVREITTVLPAYIYDGRVYVPLEIIQNLYNNN